MAALAQIERGELVEDLPIVSAIMAEGKLDRKVIYLATLLHDIGKLVLVHAYPGYPGQVHGDARTPEERLQKERRELGVDHALVGGVLARRWALPRSLASVIERHHAADAYGLCT